MLTLMTYKETAAYLKISRSTLYRMVTEDRIPLLKKKSGRSRLFCRELLVYWLMKGQPKDCKNLAEKYFHDRFNAGRQCVQSVLALKLISSNTCPLPAYRFLEQKAINSVKALPVVGFGVHKKIFTHPVEVKAVDVKPLLERVSMCTVLKP